MKPFRMLNKIIEFVILTLVVLLCSVLARATTVTGTLVDPTGQVIANANISIEFKPASGTNGSPTIPTTTSLVTDAAGTFSTTITANNTIVPSGSTYTFTICPNATVNCSVVSKVSIVGATQDISTILNAGINQITVSAQTLLPKAYNDSEVPVRDLTNVGAIYWNSNDKSQHLWDGTAWTSQPSLTNMVNVADWQSVASLVSRQDRSSFSVTQVTKSWFVNSILSAGTGTAAFGYGNVWLPSNPVFTIRGCGATQWIQRGAGFNDNLYWNCQQATNKGDADIPFIAASDYVDAVFRGDAANFKITVDGKPTSAYAYTVNGVDSNPVEYRLQLDGKPHRVNIECLRCGFAGIITPNGPGSTDLLAADWDTNKPTGIAVGNSHTYGQNSSTTNPLMGLTPINNVNTAKFMCSLLGLYCNIAGAPGTDYVNPGGTTGNYSSRITADVCNQPRSFVLWPWTGWNDRTVSFEPTLRATALATYQAVSACTTNVLQLVIGPFAPTDDTSLIKQVDTDLKNAVADARALGVNIFYVASPIDERWINGTHTSCGSINTTGNSCMFVGDDVVHLNAYGSIYVAIKSAQAIAKNFPQLFAGAFDFNTPISLPAPYDENSFHTSTQKTGTLSVTNGLTTVVGTGTRFLEELRNGWKINVNPGGGGAGLTPVTVSNITDDTHLTLSANWTGTTQGAAPFQLGMYPIPEKWGIDSAGNIRTNNALAVTGAKASGSCPVVQVDNTTISWATCAGTTIFIDAPIPTISLSASSTGAMAHSYSMSIDITRLQVLIQTSPAGCTTPPVWGIKDITGGGSTVIAQMSIPNGVLTRDAFLVVSPPVTVPANHTIVGFTTIGVACGTAGTVGEGMYEYKRTGT